MSSNIISPSPKKKVAPSEKIIPSDEVERGTKTLNYTEETVVTICRKDLNNFQGKFKRSTCWFNIHCERLKEKFSTLEPDLYTLEKMNIEGQEIETYQNFVVLLDNNKSTEKLDIPVLNDSVTPNN